MTQSARTASENTEIAGYCSAMGYRPPTAIGTYWLLAWFTFQRRQRPLSPAAAFSSHSCQQQEPNSRDHENPGHTDPEPLEPSDGPLSSGRAPKKLSPHVENCTSSLATRGPRSPRTTPRATSISPVVDNAAFLGTFLHLGNALVHRLRSTEELAVGNAR